MPEVEAEAVALLGELVGIDSVNPGLVPGAAGETRIVEHLRSRLERSGFVTTVVAASEYPGRPSLVAVPPGPHAGPTVVLNGHLDTVGVSGMPEPFTPRVDGDRLHGRGAADMKAGVVAMLGAVRALRGADLRG
ncbi:MAG: M20/M25/M40 family metallo-hydrolase, partial [Nocardioidaceae bacterium]|nr:M20/M25/M40 family metallo-hydrolase [Nocardioidaceae bacterium]